MTGVAFRFGERRTLRPVIAPVLAVPALCLRVGPAALTAPTFLVPVEVSVTVAGVIDETGVLVRQRPYDAARDHPTALIGGQEREIIRGSVSRQVVRAHLHGFRRDASSVLRKDRETHEQQRSEQTGVEVSHGKGSFLLPLRKVRSYCRVRQRTTRGTPLAPSATRRIVMKSRSLMVSLVLLLALGTVGCGSGGIGSGSSVSLEQEWQIGEQMAAQVAQQVQLNNDPQLNAYVRSVGERIHAQTPMAQLPFHFYVVNDPAVNAFSLPGGHVYVNSGLIQQADTVDMLAGVMAHEISHNVARHVVKKIEQEQTIGVIGSILLGQNPGQLQTILANIIAGGALARFSRADEKEADDLGLGYMTKAGYNPEGMLKMFQKLLSLEKGSPSAVEKFFLDHPLTQDRINDISNRIKKMGNTGGITDDPAYQAVRRRL